MTADLAPYTRIFQVKSFQIHHGLQEPDPTRVCSGVRKWTSMHVQMGLQPKQIEAISNDKNVLEANGTCETLDKAGGKLLDKNKIRNVAHRW
ncbi:hypothetical protein F5Y13DRAFT_162758 [Hypoxylon sp. FL1857]|nr:hypothetical protein F5Y13DRAFT_162758 [Hypoxylon sp. FL1857]